MTKIEEPLERGWLEQVMRDVRNEVAAWPSNSSFPKSDQHDEDADEDAPVTPILNK